MKFNARVVRFQFAVPNPDPNVPKTENIAIVQASKYGRVYSVGVGEEIRAVGEKVRVKVDKDEKATLVDRA